MPAVWSAYELGFHRPLDSRRMPPAVTATAATVLAEQLRPLCQRQNWCLVGPAPAPVARVAGRSRWQLLLHGPAGSSLPLPPGQELWNTLPKGVALSVDPDPMEL